MTRALGIGIYPGRNTGVVSAATTPLTIMAAGGGGVLRWVRSDFVTTNAGRCTSLIDQSGNGHTFNEVGGAGPTYTTGSLDGRAALQFNGTTMYLENTSLVWPAPGTTPTWRWWIFRQVAWTNGRALMSSVTGFVQEIYQSATTPRVRLFNTTNSTENAAATIASAFRGECLFSNSTNDYLKIGSTTVTGVNTGNSSGGGGYRLGRDSGAGLSSYDFFEMVEMNRNPSAGEKTAMDSYGAGLYLSASF